MPLILIAIASVMNASFSLPMKKITRWSWQTSWSVWTIFALLALPVIAAFMTVPDALEVYRAAGLIAFCRLALCGLGWGFAQVLFGIALQEVGLATTFSLVLGSSACLGAIIPLLLRRDELGACSVALILGIAMMSAGLLLCAWAGQGREREISTDVQASITSSRSRGVAIALVSGICASSMNIGLACSGGIIQGAISRGASPPFAANAVWLPMLVFGAVPNLAYCVYLSNKRQSGHEVWQAGTKINFLLALIMAVMWFGSSILYGSAVSLWGSSGAERGWPIFMSMIVVAAGLLSLLTGEWLTVSKRLLLIQVAGMVALVFGVFIIAHGSK